MPIILQERLQHKGGDRVIFDEQDLSRFCKRLDRYLGNLFRWCVFLYWKDQNKAGAFPDPITISFQRSVVHLGELAANRQSQSQTAELLRSRPRPLLKRL